MKAEKDIEDENQRLNDADGGSHAIRRQEVEENQVKANDIKRRLKDHEDELPALEDNKKRAEIEHREIQEQIQRKRKEVQDCEQRLNSMQRDKGQRQGAYSANMPTLITAIRQDGGFQQKPVGPIGNHVRLLNPVWSSILEKSFGTALESFVVTSKQDQSRLSDIMKRVSW